jgi:acetyltransferase-like isoleucine patch superfamily enzyme
MTYPKALVALFHKSKGEFLFNAIRTTLLYLAGKAIIAHHKVRFKRLKNVEVMHGKTLVVGLFPNEFGAPSDVTFINVAGKLSVMGNFDIGRGARISIGGNAIVTLASGFINNNAIFAIEHKLVIGNDCAIGWNVQIMDDDYHDLVFEGRQPVANNGVTIGEHVWIGSNVTMLKNTVIPNGCVVAAGSLVNQKFDEPNCLIGGSPARVLRKNVQWK